MEDLVMPEREGRLAGDAPTQPEDRRRRLLITDGAGMGLDGQLTSVPL